MATLEPHAERPRCLVCRQPAAGCWCGHLSRQQSRTRVVLLQHPREARNPLSTARMAHLALAGSQLLVGVDFEEDPRFVGLLESEREQLVVLWPTPEARPLEELSGRETPVTLVAIDGTWWQARKIWQRNPSLRSLPAYKIEPTAPSRIDVIRPEPEAHCLSTVEAIATALDEIESAPGRHAAMLEPLEALVERQLGYANTERSSPRRRARPRPRRSGLPEPLEGCVEDALLVHAEANGWPARLKPRPPTELVHWLAVRPATGERFSALLRPQAGFAPDAFEHLALEPAAFEEAISREELGRRWSAFVRPEDVWCAWGFTPARLLEENGMAQRMAVDLRAFTSERMRVRPSSIEAALGLMKAATPEPTFAGRGGKRLAILETLFAALLASCDGDERSA